MIQITKDSELTPIEEYHGILFKRDDCYLPYKDLEIGGGKVRQMQALYASILKKHGTIKGLITNPVSFSSSQSAIVAKVARDNDVPCIVAIGGKINSVEATAGRYKPLKLALELGAEIRVVAGAGYSNIVTSRVKEIVKDNNYQVVDFGINLSDYPEAIIGSTADQVANLPDNLDNLIIPCGSALTMAGIILGVVKFKKNIKRIIGIQICSKDRRKNIDQILNQFGISRNYEFIVDNTFPYSKNIEYYIDADFELNVKYESKAFLYYTRHFKELEISEKDKTVFWCVGNNNFLFN